MTKEEGITKKELTAKLTQIVEEAKAKLAEAQKFADKHKLVFDFLPAGKDGYGSPLSFDYHGMKYYGEDEAWSWMNSSIGC